MGPCARTNHRETASLAAWVIAAATERLLSPSAWWAAACVLACAGCGSLSAIDDAGIAPRPDASTTDAGVGGDAATSDGPAPAANADVADVDGSPVGWVDCPAGTISGTATSIAAVSNGLVVALSLPGGGGGLERYVGQGCDLAKDDTFHPVALPSGAAAIAVDRRDHLYFGAAGDTGLDTVELDTKGALVQRIAEASAGIAVTSDGLVLYTAFVSSVARSIRADPSQPFVTDPAFISPHAAAFVEALLAGGGGFLVGGKVNTSSPGLVFAVAPGGSITAMYGYAGDLSAPDAFCTTPSIAPCGSGGFCVVDSSCGRFSQWTSAGRFRTGFTFSDGRQPLSLASGSTAGAARVYVLHTEGPPPGPNALGIVYGLN
jgi:hypothetical protein